MNKKGEGTEPKMKYARWVLASVALLVIATGALVSVMPRRIYADYTSHAPISIGSNSQFDNAHGVTSGSGTKISPYVIENWVISTSSANGIDIEDTTAYFIIRNCLIENGGSRVNEHEGIYLNHVTNGTIKNNILDNNYYDIDLGSRSDNIVIDTNTCFNSYGGIHISSDFGSYGYIYNDNIINNYCYNTYGRADNISTAGLDTWNGIGLYYTENCIISNNICENGSHAGIKLSQSYYDNVKHNNCENNYNNIYIDETTNRYNLVSNNTCNYGGYGITLDSATDDNNYIYNNICRYNENWGIGSWEACYGNIITNNNCSYSQNLHGYSMGYGIFFTSGSYNNFIAYNYLAQNTIGNGYDAGSNAWDNQTTHRGNYWDNWQPGSGGRTSADGIVVDNVYTILGGIIKDNYPLVFTSIYIDGNAQFDNAHGVTSGAGILANPYIIENKVISALASTYGGIYITSTTSYFVVRNCLIENGFTDFNGIHLDSVTNGRIENNICNNSDVNIYLAASSFDNIRNNTCSGGSEGIGFGSSSDNNILDNNKCENNVRGIYLYNASFNILNNNVCNYNSEDAIDLGTGANNNLLTNNTCDNSSNVGIHLYHSSTNVIRNNTCSYDSNSGIYISESSPNNTISNNTCSNNHYGIVLASCGTPENIDNNICLSNTYYGINVENSTYANVTNNTCSYNLEIGIVMDVSNNGIIRANICNYNYIGINLTDSFYENVVNNTCSYNVGSDNTGIGIYLAAGSVYENIVGNTCENNGGDGIDLGSNANYNFISRNICKDTVGQWVYDNVYDVWTNQKEELHLYHANNNTIDNNTFSRTPPVSFVWDNTYDNWTDSQNDYGIALSYSDNNIISNNICLNNISVGIHTGGGSDNNLIENNYCDSNFYGIARNGIAIYLENYSIVRNNLCENSSHAGIKLGGSADNLGNSISGCYYDNILNNICLYNKNGVYVDETRNLHNLIENNVCRYGKYGITLDSPDDNYNTIDNNTFENNIYNVQGTSGLPCGIFIDFPNSNNIITNNIVRYDNYGIYLTTAHNNTIYLNYILYNSENNAHDDNHNAWDNQTGGLRLGNYWSDWQPPAHPDPDNDGVVNTPRPILAGTSLDNYPLVLEGGQVYYTLSLGMVGTGTVSESGSEPHPAGENVLLSATASAGWRFNHWSGAPINGVTDNVTSIIMNDNYSINAVFTAIPTYTLTMLPVIGSGSVVPTVGSHTENLGENVAISATASGGWRFDHWTGGWQLSNYYYSVPNDIATTGNWESRSPVKYISAVDTTDNTHVPDNICSGVGDQSVINAALASGAKKVVLFNGHYNLSDTVYVPTGVTLTGTTRDRTILYENFDYGAIVYMGSDFDVDGVNILIENITCGGKGRTPATERNGIYHLKENEVVRNCRVENFAAVGIYLEFVGYAGSNIWIENNIVNNTGAEGIDIEPYGRVCENIYITGNVVGGCGIGAPIYQTGGHGIVVDKGADKTVIANNIVENSGQEGIAGLHLTNFFIQGNLVENNSALNYNGHTESVYNIQISGDTENRSDNVTVMGNSVRGYYGIACDNYTENSSFLYNDVSACTVPLNINGSNNVISYGNNLFSSYVTDIYAASTSIIMDDNKTIGAVFTKTYTLTVTVTGSGTTNPVAGTHTYDNMENVSVSATASSNYRFNHWTDNLSGTDNVTSIIMDNDKTVGAVFTATYTLTMSVTGSGTTNPAVGVHTYDTGENVTISENASSTWRFDHWTGGFLSGSQNPTSIIMNGNKTVGAYFIKTYTLTISVDNGSGSVTPSVGVHTYDNMENVAISENATLGYTFDHWTGNLSGSTNPTSIIMSDNRAVGAFFVATVNHAPTCSITYPATGYSTTTGTSITFTCTASDPDNDNLTYLWDFGDNTTATSTTPAHSYSSAGAYGVLLTVSDGSLTGTDRITVNITAPSGGPSGGPSNTTPNTTPTTSEMGIPLGVVFIAGAIIAYLLKQRNLAYLLAIIGIILLVFASTLTIQQVIG